MIFRDLRAEVLAEFADAASSQHDRYRLRSVHVGLSAAQIEQRRAAGIARHANEPEGTVAERRGKFRARLPKRLGASWIGTFGTREAAREELGRRIAKLSLDL